MERVRLAPSLLEVIVCHLLEVLFLLLIRDTFCRIIIRVPDPADWRRREDLGDIIVPCWLVFSAHVVRYQLVIDAHFIEKTERPVPWLVWPGVLTCLHSRRHTYS